MTILPCDRKYGQRRGTKALDRLFQLAPLNLLDRTAARSLHPSPRGPIISRGRADRPEISPLSGDEADDEARRRELCARTCALALARYSRAIMRRDESDDTSGPASGCSAPTNRRTEPRTRTRYRALKSKRRERASIARDFNGVEPSHNRLISVLSPLSSLVLMLRVKGGLEGSGRREFQADDMTGWHHCFPAYGYAIISRLVTRGTPIKRRVSSEITFSRHIQRRSREKVRRSNDRSSTWQVSRKISVAFHRFRVRLRTRKKREHARLIKILRNISRLTRRWRWQRNLSRDKDSDSVVGFGCTLDVLFAIASGSPISRTAGSLYRATINPVRVIRSRAHACTLPRINDMHEQSVVSR